MPRHLTGEVYLDRERGNFPYYFYPLIGGVRAYRDMRREGGSHRRAQYTALFSQIPTSVLGVLGLLSYELVESRIIEPYSIPLLIVAVSIPQLIVGKVIPKLYNRFFRKNRTSKDGRTI